MNCSPTEGSPTAPLLLGRLGGRRRFAVLFALLFVSRHDVIDAEQKDGGLQGKPTALSERERKASDGSTRGQLLPHQRFHPSPGKDGSAAPSSDPRSSTQPRGQNAHTVLK